MLETLKYQSEAGGQIVWHETYGQYYGSEPQDGSYSVIRKGFRGYTSKEMNSIIIKSNTDPQPIFQPSVLSFQVNGEGKVN